jgi:hypothetical protein
VNSIAAEAKRTVLHRCIDRRLRWWASIDDNKQKGTLPSYYPVRRAGTAVQERKAGKGQKGAAKSTQETGAKEQRFRAARKERNGKVGLGLLVRHVASSDEIVARGGHGRRDEHRGPSFTLAHMEWTSSV